MKVNDLLQEWRHVLETLDLIVEPRIEDLKVSHVTHYLLIALAHLPN